MVRALTCPDYTGPMVRDMGVRPLGTADDGARAVVELLQRSLAGTVTGRYFDGGRAAKPDPQAENPVARRRLRELTERLVTSPRTPR